MSVSIRRTVKTVTRTTETVTREESFPIEYEPEVWWPEIDKDEDKDEDKESVHDYD